MSAPVVGPSASSRVLTSAGAVLAACSIGLAAYAAHNADAEVRASLQTAAVFAFGHGIALATLAPHSVRTLARVALAAMLLGALCFSGSLAAAHFLGVPTSLAPFGGSLMILSWLVFAIDALRR